MTEQTPKRSFLLVLPDEEMDDLETLAKQNGITKTQQVKNAIALGRRIENWKREIANYPEGIPWGLRVLIEELEKPENY